MHTATAPNPSAAAPDERARRATPFLLLSMILAPALVLLALVAFGWSDRSEAQAPVPHTQTFSAPQG